LKVKEYSNKKESHLACPECGFDLSPSDNKQALMKSIKENSNLIKFKDSSNIIENNSFNTNIKNEKAETTIVDSPAVETNQENAFQKTKNNGLKKVTIEDKIELENKPPILSEIQEPQITLYVKPENLENINLMQEQKRAIRRNEKRIRDARKYRPAGCNNYFSYLYTLPKGAATPDECYACVRLIDCYREPVLN
jgi:hypothetical protein